MGLKSAAVKEATEFFESLGRGLIHDFIQFRRSSPCFFARVNRNMAKKFRERPRFKGYNEWRARQRDRIAERYEARCEAQDALLAAACGICKPSGEGPTPV